MFGFPAAQIAQSNGVGERASGGRIGTQNRALRIHDLRGLGHEVDTAHDDHGCVGLARLDGKSQRVSDKIGDVLNFGDLVVVCEDHRVAFARQVADCLAEGHETTSNEKSRTPAEWVRAPSETKSTPLRATSARFCSVMPPLASSRARLAVRSTAWRRSSTEKLSSRISRAPAASASSSSSRFVTSTSTT